MPDFSCCGKCVWLGFEGKTEVDILLWWLEAFEEVEVGDNEYEQQRPFMVW